MAVQELAIGHDRANRRLRIHVVKRPTDEGIGCLIEERVVDIIHVTGSPIVGGHHTERDGADLTRQLQPVIGVYDRTRMYEGDRRRKTEDLSALQEKRPQLPEKEWEPLVDLDLGAIRFDLGEVGVDRKVGGEVRCDSERAEIDVVQGGLRRCPRLTAYLCVKSPGDAATSVRLSRITRPEGPRGVPRSRWVRRAFVTRIPHLVRANGVGLS